MIPSIEFNFTRPNFKGAKAAENFGNSPAAASDSADYRSDYTAKLRELNSTLKNNEAKLTGAAANENTGNMNLLA